MCQEVKEANLQDDLYRSELQTTTFPTLTITSSCYCGQLCIPCNFHYPFINLFHIYSYHPCLVYRRGMSPGSRDLILLFQDSLTHNSWHYVIFWEKVLIKSLFYIFLMLLFLILDNISAKLQFTLIFDKYEFKIIIL